MTHEELIEMHAMVHDADQRSKSNTHRLDKMEERQDNLDKLVASVAVMAEKQDNMGKTVDEIKTTVKAMASTTTVNTLKQDVETLKSKPAKRWEGVVDKIIMLIVGAVIAYALTKLGL